MLSKTNPKLLVLVLVVGILLTLGGAAAVGFGAAMIYTQRQTNDMVMRLQSSEEKHNLELKNARLEERNTCEARLTIANTSSDQMKGDIATQKAQIASLVGSVDRLTKLTQQRASKGNEIANKVDKLTKKVDDTTIISPPQTLGKERADQINKKIEEINKGPK